MMSIGLWTSFHCKKNTIAVCFFSDSNYNTPCYCEFHLQEVGIDVAILLTIRAMLERLYVLNRGIHNIGITRKKIVEMLNGKSKPHSTMPVILEDISLLCNFKLGNQIGGS